MVIVEENQEYGSIIGSSSAPYINSLATKYASATKWYAVQHNSPTDYLDLLVGSDLGLPNGQPYSSTTLVDELHTGSIPWQAYMENLASSCSTASDPLNLYDPIHNPFHYFTKYTTSSGGWCSSANASSEGVLPYPGSSSLVSTLNGANAPDFVWITPNDCDNMHGDTTTGSGCATSSGSQLINLGDTWLSSNLALVLTSTWFKQNGIVIVTWDEGTTSAGCCNLSAPGGHIPTIVVTAANQGLGSFTGVGDHYGTLRAVEEAYGVGFLGGSGNTVNGDLTGAFGIPTVGSISGTVLDTQTPGHPVTTATVSYTGTNGSGSTTAINASTGAYTLAGVPAGTYTVTASATGYTTQTNTGVVVSAGATTNNVNFLMPAVSGTISGTVTSGGTGLIGATVAYTGPLSGSTSTSDGAGDYQLTNLSAGTYQVTASKSGYSPQTIEVTVTAGGTETGNNFILLAGSSGSITGTVTDAQTSLPISGATVTDGINAPVTTDTHGNFVLEGVTPNSYTVTVTAASFVTGSASVTVNASANTTQNFSLTEDGQIVGKVTDASTHNGIPNASITCTCAGSATSTDGSGNYSFAQVTPGTYTVSVTATGYTGQSNTNVVVNPGTPTTQNFQLGTTSATLSVVQSFGAANTSAGTTLVATPSVGTTTGDLLVATIRTRVTTAPAATVTGVTDSAGNTWVKATSVVSGSLSDGEVWYAANATSDTSVTATVSVSSAVAFTVIEVAGAAAATPLDQTATKSGSSTAPSVGPTSPTTQANEIVIADIGWNTSLTVTGQSAGYVTTQVEQSKVSSDNSGEQAAWQILSATGTPTYAATLSGSVAWTGVIATFS